MVMLLRAHATSRAGELQIIADQIHERDHNVEVGSANLWSLDESLQPVGVDSSEAVPCASHGPGTRMKESAPLIVTANVYSSSLEKDCARLEKFAASRHYWIGDMVVKSLKRE